MTVVGCKVFHGVWFAGGALEEIRRDNTVRMQEQRRQQRSLLGRCYHTD